MVGIKIMKVIGNIIDILFVFLVSIKSVQYGVIGDYTGMLMGAHTSCFYCTRYDRDKTAKREGRRNEQAPCSTTRTVKEILFL